MNKKLFKMIIADKKNVAIALICAILSVITNLLGPYFIGKSIDCMNGIGNVYFEGIFFYIIYIALIYIINAVSLWFLNICSNKIAYSVSQTLRMRMFEKLKKVPLNFYDTKMQGDILSRFTADADALSNGLLQCLLVLITGILTIVGAIFIMLKINIFMSLIVIMSAPLAYFVARFITLRTKRYFKEQAGIAGSLNGYAEEIISNQKMISAFSYYETAKRKYRKQNAALYKVGVKAQFYSSLANPSTRLVNNTTYAAVGVLGCMAVIGGAVTVGNVSSFLIYANIFAKPFNEITGVISNFQEGLASSKRIFDLLSEDEISGEENSVPAPKSFKGEIEFKNVSFSYMPEKPLIKNFNLKINAGMHCAIVGGTGAGKTTLVNLLMRFYDISEGDILIDGQSIYSMTRDSLRNNFGMVLQDSVLFEGTIEENISYGRPCATFEQIKSAAVKSGAHSFIRRLPEGYQTVISEGAKNLSEGQKQLLTITRVMLCDPEILILDEATSSVDTVTEMHIQSAFNAMIVQRTSFVIAHRLSTVRDSDIILVMDHGDVVESGTHEELLKKNGVYSKLYSSQFSK